MEKTIYIIGHKSPDTDTICSAIAYSEYLKTKGQEAIPARSGDLNPETKYVLDCFGFEPPINLDSLKEKTVILVDHNEKSQSPEGIETARIIEVIDHHKIEFSSAEPINFQTKPLGSTATLIAQKLLNDQDFEITKPLAGILISAILSDTVIFKSNTSTPTDVELANKLNEIAQIPDLQNFGLEIKKKKSSLEGLTPEQIIYSDFKSFEVNNQKFAIGQVETVDLSEAKKIEKALFEKINEIKEKESFAFVVLMLTDIINEGSNLLISSGADCLEKAFNKEINENSVYLEKMMSRKKDLLPLVLKALENK
jgi:manganese-dependent inorganic pyrophosphatase